MGITTIVASLVTALNVHHMDIKQLECIIEATYFESGILITNDTDKKYIIDVITNRVRKRSWPNSVCEVVRQRKWSDNKKKWVCQFSYYCDFATDEPRLDSYYHHKLFIDHSKKIIAMVRADIIYNKDYKRHRANMYKLNYANDWDSKRIDHYHHKKLSMIWSKRMVLVHCTNWHCFFKSDMR